MSMWCQCLHDVNRSPQFTSFLKSNSIIVIFWTNWISGNNILKGIFRYNKWSTSDRFGSIIYTTCGLNWLTNAESPYLKWFSTKGVDDPNGKTNKNSTNSKVKYTKRRQQETPVVHGVFTERQYKCKRIIWWCLTDLWHFTFESWNH
jgi:hypothetical protein